MTGGTDHLPPFSGRCPPCKKCGLPRGRAVGTTTRYIAEGGVGYVERRCGNCTYAWHERCADEDWDQCVDCGGCAYPPLLGGKPKCDICMRGDFLMRTYSPTFTEEEN